MDSFKAMLYTFARLGLLLMLDLFGMFVGGVIFPGIASFMPTDGKGAVKQFLTNPIVGSVIGYIVMTAILVWIFRDDGKKHAAYEEWSWENILIVMMIMLMAAFVPSIFRESYKESATMTVVYNGLYYPLSWLCDGVGTGLTRTYQDETPEGLGLPYTVAVLVGNGIQLALCFGAYVAAFKIYVKQHPSILKAMKQETEPEEETENLPDDVL
ncbi:hypothetical protein [Ruminococcus sp. NK3A76]|uniref:hypothetical protein n=1 Tax=Ruminococcus sp. NK3A76 TaxID=877411 RepID=UPI0006903EAA|nr:hypothetical protein [Ruminococcus sp. NK3A76]